MASFNPGIVRMKNYFLKGLLTVYIIAFTSLYVQVQTLFGDNGIVPMRDFFSKQSSHKVAQLQNIVALAPKLGLNYGEYIELLCIVNILIALAGLLVKRLSNALTFGLLWYTYYSICQVGQGFMTFHSDLLLIEVGFIAILLSPIFPSSKLSQNDHDPLSFFLIRWLTFRYFITNVLNVYLDGDDAWYKMTAIPMVAQGVQFPSLFSWHVYNLPLQYIKLYQAYEHTVKLCAPFLMLFDLRYTRLLAFYTLLFVAVPSALFFNFGWTDLLIAICLISYLKDAYFYDDKRAKQSGLRTFLDIMMVFAYIGIVVAILVSFYGIKYDKGVFEASVKFTPEQFKTFVQNQFVPASLVFGLLGLLSSLHTTYFSGAKKTSILKTLLYTLVAVFLFLSTIPTLTRFSPGLENKIKPLALTKDLSRHVAPLMLSNNYILMSKVSQHYGDVRPELQVQARSNDDPTYLQYDLRFKPGTPSRELVRVVPHLPRVDLKMWYAARSSLQNNQWLQTFAYRLATKERDVTSVLARDTVMPKAAYLRVVNLAYKYAAKNRLPFAGYWSQSTYKNDYVPEVSFENLKSAVKNLGVNVALSTKPAGGVKTPSSIDQLLSLYLGISSEFVRSLDHAVVIWSILAVATVSIFR